MEHSRRSNSNSQLPPNNYELNRRLHNNPASRKLYSNRIKGRLLFKFNNSPGFSKPDNNP